MKNIQIKVVLDGGEAVCSDVMPVTEETRKDLLRLVDAVESVNELTKLSIIQGHDRVFFNVKKISYIKVIST